MTNLTVLRANADSPGKLFTAVEHEDVVEDQVESVISIGRHQIFLPYRIVMLAAAAGPSAALRQKPSPGENPKALGGPLPPVTGAPGSSPLS